MLIITYQQERQQRETELRGWRKRSISVFRAHQVVAFIKGSQLRLEAFRALTTDKEFALSLDDRDDALAFLDEARAEPSAIDLVMPPPRPISPTEPQTGDIRGGLSVKMANDTRWNSDEVEWDRLLKLRKAVNYFVLKAASKGEKIERTGGSSRRCAIY